MPVYHVTLFFASGQHGWREQLYRVEDTTQQALAAAVALAQARYSLLGFGVSLYKVRVSQVGAPGVAASQRIIGLPLTATAMNPYEGAEIRLEAGTEGKRRRSYFLRGLPVGAIVQYGGASRWGAAVQTAALAWLARLADGRWCEQVRAYAGSPMPIVNMTVLAAPLVEYPAGPDTPLGPTLYTSALWIQVAGQPFVPPDLTAQNKPAIVRVSRVRWTDLDAAQATPINGEFVAIGAQGSSIQCIGQGPTSGEYAGGGTVQVTQFGYLPITSARLTRGGTRHCGPAPADAQADPGPAPTPLFSLPGIPTINEVLVSSLDAMTRLFAAIRPLVILPPVIDPTVPPPFPPPVSGHLHTSYDVLQYIAEELTYSGEGVNYTPIGIAKVVNLENTWFVGLAGFYETEKTATGCAAAVSAGMAQMNTYARTVHFLVEQNIPDDAKIFWAGYSLGGMTAENVAATLFLRPRIAQVVTFGSPITGIRIGDMPIVRFKCLKDLVPSMTPLGWAANMTDNNQPYTFIRPDPVYPDWIDNHIFLYNNTDFQNYDAWGKPPADRPPLILGFLRKFRPNP